MKQRKKETEYMGNSGESVGLDMRTWDSAVFRWQCKEWTRSRGESIW